MSLYIGKNVSNNPSLHITSSYISEANLQASTAQANTNFMSGLPFFNYLGTETYALSAGGTMSATYKSMIEDDNAIVLSFFLNNGILYKVGEIVGTYMPYSYWNGSSYQYRVPGTSSAQYLLIIYCLKEPAYPTTAGIFIGSGNITIGSINLMAKKIISMESSIPTQFGTSYLLSNGLYLNIYDPSLSQGLLLDGNSIYFKDNGTYFPFLTSSETLRINTFYYEYIYASHHGGDPFYFNLSNVFNAGAKIAAVKPYLFGSISGTAYYIRVHFALTIDVNISFSYTQYLDTYYSAVVSYSSVTKILTINKNPYSSDLNAADTIYCIAHGV
jgi:hypothetical protein